MNAAKNVLLIEASGRRSGSVTRTLTRDLVAAIEQREGAIEVVSRDLADGMPFVDDAWIAANTTAEEDRTAADREALAESDRLVDELEAADIVVIGAPIYNFGIPAVLKAWVDMIARARRTFRYTANGPVGLLNDKKAYVVVASAGVPVGSPVDFATPYLKHALGFVGIDDTDVVAADQHGHEPAAALDAARQQIAELVHTTAAQRVA